MKTVYGPVSSWRLGRSLGIDPVCSDPKVCSFDCVYCQLGSGEKTAERRKLVKTYDFIADLKEAAAAEADVATFAGTGEPTLATNLGDMLRYLKSNTDLPAAILTNGSMMDDENVARALREMDIVVAKLDAPNARLFRKINRPHESIDFERYLDAMRAFREGYEGRFALQMMFTESNFDYAADMADIAAGMQPDEVQINTPLRPCAVEPLSREDMEQVSSEFGRLDNVISVYDAEKPEVKPIDMDEVRLRKRPEA